MKDRGVCEMKYIMKSIKVRIEDIISERVTNKDVVPAQVALTTFTLCYFYFKFIRKALFFLEGGVEGWQHQNVWLGEATARLAKIASCHFPK